MQQWDYFWVEYYRDRRTGTDRASYHLSPPETAPASTGDPYGMMSSDLADFGKQGWELVSVVAHAHDPGWCTFWFKRPKSFGG